MNHVLTGMLAALAIALAIVGAVAYGGVIDVSADAPHGQFVSGVIAVARERSIARRLDGLSPPPDLTSAARASLGAGNYEAMCAGCHLRPGQQNSELRAGLYPQPPNLAMKSGTVPANPARRFWIIKHGIKASGMPAWGKGGMSDTDIWNLVGFLDRLPELSPTQYQSLQAASLGHSHDGTAVEAEDHHDSHGHSH